VARPPESLPVRFVTATALFDGHDASINLVRRLLTAEGAEVIHLGHNRSVAEVTKAVVEEDAHAVAVSSYQGGHMEYFEYLLESLRAAGRPDVRVFGGGGGVIVPEEIAALEAKGVTKVFSPEDGARLGLSGMARTMVAAAREVDLLPGARHALDRLLEAGDTTALARVLTALEAGALGPGDLGRLDEAAKERRVPVIGVTGTGGSGKSSLVDELVLRFLLDDKEPLRIAVLAVDPSRRKGGGALLADRIRMNTLDLGPVFFRSMATRGGPGQLPACIDAAVVACKAAGFELVVVETPGVGQGDDEVVDHVDLTLYVMTPEFGAPSQLEKIAVLDEAAIVVVNKFDRLGSEDAMRDVRRLLARQLRFAGVAPEDLPVFGTIASRVSDDGVTACYQHLRDLLEDLGLSPGGGLLERLATRVSTKRTPFVPESRSRYLAEIAECVRDYHRRTEEMVDRVRVASALELARPSLEAAAPHDALGAVCQALDRAIAEAWAAVPLEGRELLEEWPKIVEFYTVESPARADGDVRARSRETLSGTRVARVALPRFAVPGAEAELLRWLREEHVPGHFPYTAGVFPFRREDEEPTRMFAGEGTPRRTNARFHLLADGQPFARLSVAFDSVTLYGFDPEERLDVYGKIGNSGVSVATIDDMRELFEGFDLVAPNTSVSMTINGPAPAILAMFLNVAIDQALAKRRAELGRDLTTAEEAEVRREALRSVRGTVQADILKEDQGQNTCIFSTDFSLRAMADVQQWFVDHDVRRFYSVSVSGYHIAEAGANPVTQLAFTLANGFTYVEAYLARGMCIDDVAPSLSFFFSAGMDPEYSVLGRVARRIWAIVMRDRYGASPRAQRLKYHVQTSGRSLHAQEMQFNDIRTTLQALHAFYDNCNSLHTNAYDEAVTTPTEESVRRALAIQLIVNREWGLAKNENPLQGSFVIEQLTHLVEQAVLEELERLSERGGVLGAMELGYQRGRIQEESLLYEHRKHDGSLPIIGVNTFRREGEQVLVTPPTLSRSTDEEKREQLERVRRFKAAHEAEAQGALERLRRAAASGENIFEVLMDAVRVCTLGQITQALFEVGGRYRRNL
jgi:methylmalonyl-CoA mutase